jgi:hypothetical protein
MYPLPRHFFREAVVHYSEEGTLPTDVPSGAFIPLSSVTFVLGVEDPDLDPNRDVRPSIRSILRAEFEGLGVPKAPTADLISKEKEWFASTDRRVIGTVVQDLPDKDWFYVLFLKTPDGKIETEDVQINIPTRKQARQRLLDAMAACLET